jgi:hypothetical protein
MGGPRCAGHTSLQPKGSDTPEAILAGTRELLAAIARANGIATEDIASAFLPAPPPRAYRGC